MLSKEEIENKIEQLERDRIGYLEVDNKVAARRKQKQIEELEMQLKLLDFKDIEQDLELYKKFIRKRNLESEFKSFMIAELARN